MGTWWDLGARRRTGQEEGSKRLAGVGTIRKVTGSSAAAVRARTCQRRGQHTG